MFSNLSSDVIDKPMSSAKPIIPSMKYQRLI